MKMVMLLKMSEEDKNKSFGDLFNTLFLITPVFSSTFASIENMFSYVKKNNELGVLIIDEAGQAPPQIALGALFRSRKAIVVGDPQQIEPVVSDELDAIKNIYKNEKTQEYQSSKNSVQLFADMINPLGTKIHNGIDPSGVWIGSPLIVHRRCISPMFEISNAISYNGLMKQQTILPSASKESTFCSKGSQWINVYGNEKGNKNHYVIEQGNKVCHILEIAFQKQNYNPNLFVITPFISIKNELITLIKEKFQQHEQINIADWTAKHIGTVHTFQGKEADEVIFVLGCDKTALGAIQWLNNNIVNVAVTRAKYRLYVIGDYHVWKHSKVITTLKTILDGHATKELSNLAGAAPTPENKKRVTNLLDQVPKNNNFMFEDYISDVLIDTFDTAIGEIFLNKSVSEDNVLTFTGMSQKIWNQLEKQLQQRIINSMNLYELFKILQQKYKIDTMDYSSAGILFCKTMELHLNQNLLPGLKKVFPEQKVPRLGILENSAPKLMLGNFTYILNEKNHLDVLANLGLQHNNYMCSKQWWGEYQTNLNIFRDLRNECCHMNDFYWENIELMKNKMFDEELFINTLVGQKIV